MKRVIGIMIGFLALSRCLAWGGDGHKMVAQIAKAYVSPAVTDSVNRYLDTLSWEEAAVWMDQLRFQHHYDYMKPWHYVNVEKDKTYVATTAPNIINQLEAAIERLKARDPLKPESTSLDLRVVFHLVGDIHQPLHVGYGVDKGGNDIDVRFLGKKKNLHSVWDSEIIKKGGITLENELNKAKALSKKQRKSIQKIDVPVWMQEGRNQLAEVYNFKDTTLDQAYLDKSKPMVEEDIMRAGLRLAAVLEEVFGVQKAK